MYYTADVVRDYEAGNAHLDDEAAASVAAAWSHLDDIYYIDDYAPEDRIGIIADDATNAAYAVAAGDVTVKELCEQLRQLDAEWQESADPLGEIAVIDAAAALIAGDYVAENQEDLSDEDRALIEEANRAVRVHAAYLRAADAVLAGNSLATLHLDTTNH